MSDDFRAKLRALPAAPARIERSAARKRIAETFDDITAAKRRGVTWLAIAKLMSEDGIRAVDGSPLSAAHVSAAYSIEKAARGERKRRKKIRSAQPAASQQAPEATGFDPNDGAPPEKAKPKFSGPAKPK